MGGMEAVSIMLNKDSSHWLDIVIHRDKIKQGFKSKVDKWSSTMSISANASWNGYHKLWKNKQTNLTLEIKSMDKTRKEAVISIKSTLYNPDTKRTISFDLKNIVIKGKNFDNLIMKPKKR